MDNTNIQTAFPIAVNDHDVNKFKCKFCNGHHTSSLCNTYNTVILKNDRAKQLKLCYNCLHDNHVISACNNPGRCRSCGRKHHTLLCRNEPQPSLTKSAVSGDDKADNKESKLSTQGKVRKNQPDKKSTSLTVMSTSNCSKSNILPTADVTILNNSNKLTCKALIDSGSQRSFILAATANRLNLNYQKQITLSIDSFDSRNEPKQYNLVTFDVHTRDCKIPVEAVVIDSIPSRLIMPGRDITVRELKSKGFKLADPRATKMIPEIRNHSYHQRIQDLDLISLVQRRL